MDLDSQAAQAGRSAATLLSAPAARIGRAVHEPVLLRLGGGREGCLFRRKTVVDGSSGNVVTPAADAAVGAVAAAAGAAAAAADTQSMCITAATMCISAAEFPARASFGSSRRCPRLGFGLGRRRRGRLHGSQIFLSSFHVGLLRNQKGPPPVRVALRLRRRCAPRASRWSLSKLSLSRGYRGSSSPRGGDGLLYWTRCIGGRLECRGSLRIFSTTGKRPPILHHLLRRETCANEVPCI